MFRTFLKALSRVFAVYILSISSAFAVEICATETSDSDADGWGWEDGMSCHVGPYNPPMYPECELSDSDSDGDGWGWENGSTCVAEGLTVPGTDFDSAGLVALDEQFGYGLAADASHYYKFTVTELTGVVAVVDADQLWDYEYYIRGEDGGYYWDIFQILEEGACLSPGTYFFAIDRFSFGDGSFDNYTATLSTVDLNCREPTVLVNTEGDDWWAGDDGYLYQLTTSNTGDSVLTRLDTEGTVYWEVELAESITNIETPDSGGVLAFTYSGVQMIDELGNPGWRLDTNFTPLDDYALGPDNLVFNDSFEFTIFSIDLNDGAVQWRYDYSSNDFVAIERVLDDGSVYLSTANGIVTID